MTELYLYKAFYVLDNLIIYYYACLRVNLILILRELCMLYVFFSTGIQIAK